MSDVVNHTAECALSAATVVQGFESTIDVSWVCMSQCQGLLETNIRSQVIFIGTRMYLKIIACACRPRFIAHLLGLPGRRFHLA